MLDRQDIRGKYTQALGSLSPRETQVLSAAADGLTNAQIADRLAVSVHAIKFHLASSYRKLRVTNRTEAVVVFLSSDASDSPATASS